MRSFAAAASAALAMLVGSVTLAPAVLAQQAPSALDAQVRKQVVEGAAKALRERYIFPDAGDQAAAKIEAALAAGAYDEISDRGAFADRLTADLQSVTKDKHMKARAMGAPSAPSVGPPPGPAPRSEAGFVRADRLAGNIGYLEVLNFPNGPGFEAAANAAMAALTGSSALIIDVRRNGGGSPQSVAYLESFFVPDSPETHLLDFSFRNVGTNTFRTQTIMSRKTPVKFIGKPVVVLTSGRTFSGGEGFAYNMQALKVAKVAGEVTGGGANPGGAGPIGGEFSLFVPAGSPTSPITKTNWEGIGVRPDLPSAADEALKVALASLGQTVDASQIERLAQASLWRPLVGVARPGSEEALRRNIEGLRAGAPDYDRMSPGVANATRTQLDMLKARVNALGAIRTMAFRGAAPNGGDIYFVGFENGPTEWRVLVSEDGRLDGINFGSPQTSPLEPERLAAFKAHDKDGDGRMDKAAYKAVLDDLGFGAQIETLFAQRDADKDGFITLAEYQTAAQ